MPHSSGGGSHFGGSHGGLRGGIVGGGPRISVRSFRGAQRFLYFDRHGQERFLYSKQMPEKQSIPSLVLCLLMVATLAYVGALLTTGTLRLLLPSRPLKPVYAQNGVHISDNANLITNKTELELSLNAFEDKTGICPYVITVFDEDWKKTHYTLEWYAYSAYIHTFSDEQHFLLVYSQPKDTQNRSNVNWSWEAMQGDDTDPILTEQVFAAFQNELQENLSQSNYNVGEAFTLSVNDSLAYVMQHSKITDSVYLLLPVMLLWDGYTGYLLFHTIRGFVYSRKRYQKAPEQEEGVQ